MISNKQSSLISSQEKRVLQSVGRRDPFPRIDNQTATHQVIELRKRVSDDLLHISSITESHSQRQRVTNVFTLRMVKHIHPHEPTIVKIPLSRVRGLFDEPEGNGPDDPLDQRQMEQVVMLRLISAPRRNGLEQHVADEQFQSDAADAPQIREFIPALVEKNLRSAVLTRVDDAVTPLRGVGGAAVVDKCEVATRGEIDALVAVVLPFCGRRGERTHFARRRPS